MRNRTIRFRTDESIPPFLSIEKACEVTGLSQYYLRNGCRSGEVPCLKSGRVYMVNVPALLEKLNTETGARS